MKLYSTTITPISSFITTLKGDTLFGQLCWAIRYTFGNNRLETLLKNYETNPFLVVSDGFASRYLPKPTMPSNLLGEDSDLKKINRTKVWLTLDDLQNGKYKQAKTNKETNSIKKSEATIKNSINYKTFTTDDSGTFSPYAIIEQSISDQDIYFLIDESQLSLNDFKSALTKLSHMGYGKKASIGKGYFTFDDLKEVKLKKDKSTSFMTISPVILKDTQIKACYYEPFVRFGKHGAELANNQPFKKPILLADSGAVIVYDEQKSIRYIGSSIKGHSNNTNTIHQGYAIVIPIKEVRHHERS
ncbi:MAG: hypothetical protein RBQ81_08450 [Arcobacteraceae bacterium]|nr:hypothetical protein [Arcobacteraceae bacterium]